MILRHTLRRNTLGLSFTLLSLALAPFALAACGGDDAVTLSSGTTTGGGGDGTGGASTGTVTGAGGSTTSGGGGTTGSGGSTAQGDPIKAPPEAWTWVPFDDAFCANGSPTGIGVNLTDKSKDALIFMMGGGACWDYLTCYLAQTAANLNGYGETQFNKDASGTLSGSVFDRSDPENPLKDYNFVFIPYCTGDVHAGNKVADYNGKMTMHVGFTNVTAYLKRLVPTFAGANRVILSGSSAGGFGAGMNWWRTQEAFGKIRVDMIDDSGVALEDPYLPKSREDTWRAAWNLNAAMPPDCPDCQTSLSALMLYYADNFKTQRSALLTYTQDTVISQFNGISQAKFEEGLKLLTPQFEGKMGFRYFYIQKAGHVLVTDLDQAGKSGTTLKTWLTQMVDDDPKWSSDNPW